MTALPHQLIEPSAFCHHHPQHQIDQRNKTAGPGVIEYCVTCTLGYEQILTASNGDEAQAERFVQFLRQG